MAAAHVRCACLSAARSIVSVAGGGDVASANIVNAANLSVSRRFADYADRVDVHIAQIHISCIGDLVLSL